MIIDENAPIETAVRQLRAKLLEAGDFFRGAAVRVDWGRRVPTEDERDALSSTVQAFGICLKETPLREAEPPAAKPAPSASQRSALPVEETLFLRRTLRSGQRIDYDGNVVVMGDVNAGAVITCSGDIIVLGSLRGLAHAGAEGNDRSIVMAFRLEPTQLRIAQYISRSPDEALPRPEGPEVARVRNGVIQIEAYVP